MKKLLFLGSLLFTAQLGFAQTQAAAKNTNSSQGTALCTPLNGIPSSALKNSCLKYSSQCQTNCKNQPQLTQQSCWRACMLKSSFDCFQAIVKNPYITPGVYTGG